MHSTISQGVDQLAGAGERRVRWEGPDAGTLECVRRVVAAAPPLTREQRERIALLLWSGEGASPGRPAGSRPEDAEPARTGGERVDLPPSLPGDRARAGALGSGPLKRQGPRPHRTGALVVPGDGPWGGFGATSSPGRPS